MLKKILTYLFLSILSGLLFAFSWPEIGDQEWMIFIAFIPLLLLEKKISQENIRFKSGAVFLFSYISFILFNWITTWWIKLASPEGMVMAVAFNSIFLSGVFTLFHLTRRNINDKVGYAALVFYWLAFEYLHINWDLSWIWLTFGNVFANRITWIQWYEYTGTLGGSFWILTINAFLFYYISDYLESRRSRRIWISRMSTAALFFILPFLISLWLFNSYEELNDPVEVMLVQPNIDPYNEKFGSMTEKEQIDRLIALSAEKMSPSIDYIFGPETAFPNGLWEHELKSSYGVQKVEGLLNEFPNAKYIVGLSSIRLYTREDEFTPTSRPLNDGRGYEYDFYNSVMQIEHDKEYQIYRKSQLVLGVEKMPFVTRFEFMKELSINLGGASGSLGIENEPKVFHSITKDGREVNIIPAICYESIYAEYLTEFVKKGGNLLAVVTNDGWWGSTAGYKQHLAYSRLRAIELRRSVARCANTGVSAFINQKGEFTQKSEWWVKDVLVGTVNLNNKITFYAANGDYFGRIAAFFAVLLLCWTVVKRIRPKL